MLSVSAARSNLNVLIPQADLRSPLCVIVAEQIQLTCNVSIKNLCVAENYAFWGSLRPVSTQENSPRIGPDQNKI